MDVLSLNGYYELRDSYIARNLYLYVFEISAPRSFGEAWAQGQLKALLPDLRKPSKKIDPEYSGQYDFFLDGIRIEVKASRATDANMDAPLYVKALASDSRKPFWMNFQQVKPGCCDVFVWVAVWRDVIRYWVLLFARKSKRTLTILTDSIVATSEKVNFMSSRKTYEISQSTKSVPTNSKKQSAPRTIVR